MPDMEDFGSPIPKLTVDNSSIRTGSVRASRLCGKVDVGPSMAEDGNFVFFLKLI